MIASAHHRRRRLVRCAAIGALAVVAASGLTACGSGGAKSADGVQTIKVGYIADMGGSAIAIANQLGLWKRAGLKVVAKSFTNGPVEVQAMAGGDIDVGYIGPGAAWLAASGHADVLAIDNIGLGDQVLGNPGKDISSLADLKGKTVGVPEGTSGQMILDLALQKAGLSPGDVKELNMDPPTTVAAYSSGRVDAAALWEPLAAQMKSKITDSKVLASDRDFYPQHVFPGMWLAKRGLTQSKTDLIKRFLWTYQQAATYRAHHVDKTVALTAKLDGVPIDQLKQQADVTKYQTAQQLAADVKAGRVTKWLSGLERLFVGMGELKSSTPPQQFFDGDLFLQARSYKPGPGA